MANSTQQPSHTVNLLNLPLEILREIVQYDTTEVSSITCKLLREAYLARPCRIKLDLTAARGVPIQHVIPNMSRYPADTYPWRVDIRLSQSTCKHVLPVLEQQFKHVGGMSGKPRITRAVRVSIYVEPTILYNSYRGNTFDVDYGDRIKDVVSFFVDLNNVDTLDIGGWAWVVLDALRPDACRLRKIVIQDNHLLEIGGHPALRIPTYVACREHLGFMTVASDTFNPELTTLQHAGIMLYDDDGGYTRVTDDSPKARETFGKWYPSIRDIRAGRLSPLPVLKNSEDPCIVSRALERGARFKSSMPKWELEELRRGHAKIPYGRWCSKLRTPYDTSLQLDVMRSMRSITARAEMYGTIREHEFSVAMRELKVYTPPTPKHSLVNWLSIRHDCIVSLAGARPKILELLRSDLDSDLVGRLTAINIVDASLRLFVTSWNQAVRLLRILPSPEITTADDVAFLDAIIAELDSIHDPVAVEKRFRGWCTEWTLCTDPRVHASDWRARAVFEDWLGDRQPPAFTRLYYKARAYKSGRACEYKSEWAHSRVARAMVAFIWDLRIVVWVCLVVYTLYGIVYIITGST